MSDDWDSKTVIGFKRQVAKVTKKDSDLNGTSSSFSKHNYMPPTSPLAVSTVMPHPLSHPHTCIYTQARRTGAVVATDKKISGGVNKAHQGTFNRCRVIALNIFISFTARDGSSAHRQIRQRE